MFSEENKPAPQLLRNNYTQLLMLLLKKVKDFSTR